MIYKAIQGLIAHAINTELITQDDVFVVRNQLMDILKLTDWHHNEPLLESLEEILGVIID